MKGNIFFLTFLPMLCAFVGANKIPIGTDAQETSAQQPLLVDHNGNTETREFRATKPAHNGFVDILFYKGIDHTGDHLRAKLKFSGGCYNFPDNFNNYVSSVDTRERCIIVYNLQNCEETLNSKQSSLQIDLYTPAHNNLAYNKFDDIISSARMCEGQSK